MQADHTIYIRDPIHGSLSLSYRELKIIDHPAMQRLRNIKQLGFADLAFPGATHSRYSHSIGAMSLATRVFEHLFRTVDLPAPVMANYYQTVRLAMLFHDIGHAPLSHTTEMLMPPVGHLKLPAPFGGSAPDKRASHEDYTLKLVLDSPLTDVIRHYFESDGISPHHIASLISERGSDVFRFNGIDYTPVLRQIVSSECDADRMDYLQRDSFYCGVNYGKFDADWLIANVVPIINNNQAFLGIKSRAIFSFEDFLLSRYHMFASVYFHHTPVIFEKLLEKFFLGDNVGFELPGDINAYIELDDIELWSHLRRSTSPWARRIVERRPYQLLDDGTGIDHDLLCERLTESGIDVIRTRSTSVLSKYFGHWKIPLYVLTSDGKSVPLESYTPLYERYKKPAELNRVFVSPEQREHAQRLLKQMLGGT